MMSRALFINGVRTPFQLPYTGYTCMLAVDLLSSAFQSLLDKMSLERSNIDHVIAGTVFHENRTSNIAREAGIRANVSASGHTITMACISGQASIGEAVSLINAGSADVVLVGGVEYLSDMPVQLSKEMRKILLASSRCTGLKDRLIALSNIRLKHFKPEYLRVVEFSTQETFIFNGDKISNRFSISREEQDEYAFNSHILSNKAFKEGKFSNFLCPVKNPTTNQIITHDSTLRSWEKEQIQAMKPVLRNGTVTFASANQPCDGAAAVVLASERAAERLNLVPRGVVSSVSYAGSSPREELLMGTTRSLAVLQKRTARRIDDVDVVELYEGFAGEILSQLKAMRSAEYCRKNLNMSDAVADLDIGRINRWGGTIGLGHPFGATGLRLLMHSIGRLENDQGNSAVVAGCAGGGLGAAFFIDKL